MYCPLFSLSFLLKKCVSLLKPWEIIETPKHFMFTISGKSLVLAKNGNTSNWNSDSERGGIRTLWLSMCEIIVSLLTLVKRTPCWTPEHILTQLKSWKKFPSCICVRQFFSVVWQIYVHSSRLTPAGFKPTFSVCLSTSLKRSR